MMDLPTAFNLVETKLLFGVPSDKELEEIKKKLPVNKQAWFMKRAKEKISEGL